jgi:large conductance mechanosensitive channel
MTTIVIPSSKSIYVAVGLYPTSEECGFYAHIDKCLWRVYYRICVGAVSEFRDFVSKGSVIDLAVAVVIGGAINAVVTAFVTDMITPLIGIPGHVDFAGLTFTVNGSTFLPGLFLNAVITFAVIALVVFFLIVKPAQKLKARAAAGQPKPEPNTKSCPECLSTIPLKATRCAYCTSKVG